MRILFLALTALALPALATAQTVRTLCASGCTYTLTEANLVTAINASVGGDSILLQQGTTTAIAITLPAHSGASNVTIRTGVSSTGALLPASQFPAANVRMTTALAGAASSNLAILTAKFDNVPPIRVAGSYWHLKHLAVTGNTYAGEALLQFGYDTPTDQPTVASIPSNITVEQMYIYGHPVYGQFRGIRAHANTLTIRDSSIRDIKGTSEGQAIYANSFTTGLTITNNYIEGGTEGILFGGAGGCCRPDVTVSSATSATAFVLSAFTDLHVGQGLSVEIGGTGNTAEQWTSVASCGGVTTVGAACTSGSITVSPALTATPAVGADVDWGIIPSDITITKNNFFKPASWRDPIVGTPQSVSAVSAETGGTLAAGTYTYRVIARHPMSVNTFARSAASVEVSATVAGSTGRVTISWAPVTNATEYRVYGRNAGGQNIYWTVTAPTTTYTDTGTTGSSEAVPTSAGSVFQIKNIFEMKNARRALIEGNVFDGAWKQAQDGYAIVLTVANTGHGNDSTTLEDITFRNNIVRNAAGGFQIVGRDVSTTTGGQISDRTKRITISNNLLYDVGTDWGATVRTVILTTTGPQTYYPNNTASNGPLSVTFNHNTFLQTGGNAMLFLDLYKGSTPQPAENMAWTNNIAYKLSYGLTGNNSCAQGSGCWTAHTSGAVSYLKNVVADATCSSYPGGTAENFCPTSAALQAEFVDYAAKNFALKSTSPYKNAASDGTDIGANIATITSLTNVAISGDNTGGPPVVPPTITTTSIPSGEVSRAYATTLAGTCPTTPCTWTSSGTLPPGLALTHVSNTQANIAGTPSVAGTYTFSAVLTASNASATQSYNVTVVDAPQIIDNRLARYNLDEGVVFRRATDPCADGEPVRLFDFWNDVDDNVVKINTQLSPTCIWTPLEMRQTLTVSTITTAGAVTYTAAQVLGGLILRDPNGAARSDVMPTAALLVAAIPSAAVGATFEFDIRNTADAAETITVTAGTGVTLSGTMTIAQNNTRRFRGVVTNAETPAVTLYSVGSFVH